ncbi:major royal jelly family protein [Methylobacterium sp. 37f]|uniref:SMP-30/gluconolactonase/LRE family protein n=1 Tax=Methylobacterium sp. 37f TaxID=2817058 RepID=UPI001FFD70FF|nr:major royal jelly family protein [Methylobacterium sp. 37f]MCK2054583.1 SMP-30/gluconolactonase/LRE family protein [Methylobacterium sp. 37f]
MTLARRDLLAAGLTGAAALSLGSEARAAAEAPVTTERTTGGLELAFTADAPSTPTGLAISAQGRRFVMMPRFDATVPYTLGEVLPDGAVRPYPDLATNQPDPDQPQARLFHVPNGVFDRDDTLWCLDAGLPDGSGPPVKGGAKLVQITLSDNRIRRVVPLDAGITPTSSLNDLRVDIRDGYARAYITDQGQDGEGAILAVDLATGRVVRRLAGHASTKSQKGLLKIVEDRAVVQRKGDGPPRPVQGGANGIALSPDGRRLYYAPLIGRRLYAVETAALLDPETSDAGVAAGVEDLGEKGMTGGLTTDSKDRVYLAMQEFNAVGRRDPDGTVTLIASDPRLIWADTFWITPDRWLHISSAQVNRRPEYNVGQDLQKPPYAILRMRIDADPA